MKHLLLTTIAADHIIGVRYSYTGINYELITNNDFESIKIILFSHYL